LEERNRSYRAATVRRSSSVVGRRSMRSAQCLFWSPRLISTSEVDPYRYAVAVLGGTDVHMFRSISRVTIAGAELSQAISRCCSTAMMAARGTHQAITSTLHATYCLENRNSLEQKCSEIKLYCCILSKCNNCITLMYTDTEIT